MSYMPLILMAAVIAYFLLRRPKQRAVVCLTCGTRGDAKRVTRGSIGIEILLWLCFLLPGLIYSAWRHASRHDACAACGSASIIPADSPVAIRQSP